MHKGDLLRRVSVFGSPIVGFPEISEGPYVLVSGPKEGTVKVSDHVTSVMMVIDVYCEDRLLHRQPVQDFKLYGES